MEKKNNSNEQSRLRAFLTGDKFKAVLPLIGFVIIIVVMHIMTNGKILTPKKLRLLFSQIYYPTIVATGVFFIMTLGSIDFTEGSTLGVASIVISVLSFYSIPLAIIGGILTGAAIGALNGFFHVKFRLPSFIVTICTMYLFRGVCAYFTTESAVPASNAIKALDQDWLKISLRRRADRPGGFRQRDQGRFHYLDSRQPAGNADPDLPGAGRSAHYRRREGEVHQHYRRYADVRGAEQRPVDLGL